MPRWTCLTGTTCATRTDSGPRPMSLITLGMKGQERRVPEIGTLGVMWRGLETAYGPAREALPEETGSQRIGRTFGVPRQSPTLLSHRAHTRQCSLRQKKEDRLKERN